MLPKALEALESPFAPSAMWGHSKKTPIYEPGSGPALDTKYASTLILDFPGSSLWEINICYL